VQRPRDQLNVCATARRGGLPCPLELAAFGRVARGRGAAPRGAGTVDGGWVDARSRTLVRATFIVGGIVVLALVAWQLVGVMLLFFGAVVVATVLRSVAELIERLAPVSSRWSLALA